MVYKGLQQQIAWLLKPTVQSDPYLHKVLQQSVTWLLKPTVQSDPYLHKVLQQSVTWLLKPTVPGLREPNPAFGNHEFQLSVRDIEHLSQTHGGLHL